jgi:hypothetical protein
MPLLSNPSFSFHKLINVFSAAFKPTRKPLTHKKNLKLFLLYELFSQHFTEKNKKIKFTIYKTREKNIAVRKVFQLIVKNIDVIDLLTLRRYKFL